MYVQKKTNLNQYIFFKPNDKAKDTYRKYMAVLLDSIPTSIEVPENKKKLIPDKEGFCKLQMWEFMRIFGSGFHLGGPPDIEMEVRIEVREDTEYSHLPPCIQCGKPCYSGGLCCSPTCYSNRNKGEPSLYAKSLSPN